jgi:hypothetical protein
VHEQYEQIIATGADVLAVGTAAGWQAAALMEGGPDRPALRFPCVVDPDHRLYEALGLGRVKAWQWLTPRLWGNYLRAFRQGSRQGAVTGDVHQLPGVAIITPDRVLRFVHRATTVGDYPSLDLVLAQLRATGAR